MGGPGLVNGKYVRELNNFYKCRILYDNMIWNSSEHLYQALKFNDPIYKGQINLEEDIATIWHMGQSKKHRLIENFEEKKVELMYTANYEKFTQNEDLKKILIGTFPYPISFSGSTPFWNDKNAEILMKIRAELIDQNK